jgi:hypothetical protein
MNRQKVKAISENLPALQHSERADDDGIIVSAISDRTGADSDFRLALSVLQTFPIQVRALLSRNNILPL